jgi:hypothetical protein
MKSRKYISALVIALFLFIRLVPAGTALADRDANPSSTPTPTPSASVSPSPSPSDSPAPRHDRDRPSPTPTPSASPSPSPTPSTSSNSSSASDGSNRGSSTTGAANTGPGGCTGTVPNWVFDSSTQKWTQADQGSFECDAATGLWLSPEYYYNEQDGWYEMMPANSVPPSYMVTAPNVVHTAVGDLVVGSQDYDVAKSLGLLDPGSGFVTSSAGTNGSTSETSTGNSNQSWFDMTSLVNIINALGSGAQSGNVAASANTSVGDAVTGAASVIANLINLLTSAWSWSNGDLAFFMQNILGNQTGDITLNPTQATNGGGGSLGQSNSSNALNVNAKNSGSITNNVDLNAASGDAKVSDNTAAGNVGTGNASAEVNIVNLINSFISSGNSFFGVLNIFGNLNGDVLFPNGFLNGLVPSGTGGSGGSASIGTTGPGSSNNANTSNSNQAYANTSANSTVANNVNTTAKSGAVEAADNTSAGNAQSGIATTTQSLYNIANSSIFGDNAVLVIVNVLGHWIGKIMTLPGGSSESALLTGNASVSGNGTGPNSTNSTSSTNSNKANVNQQADGTITNNVNVNADSGNASADQNTKVGNVTSGNASATSSVANIFNTVLNVKHWFGVLIINVFGNWTGDVGDNSGSGTGAPAVTAGTSNAAGPVVVPQVPVTYATLSNVAGPASAAINNTGAGSNNSVGDGSSSVDGTAVAAGATKPVVLADSNAGSHSTDNLFLISSIVLFVAAGLAAWERKLKRH